MKTFREFLILNEQPPGPGLGSPAGLPPGPPMGGPPMGGLPTGPPPSIGGGLPPIGGGPSLSGPPMGGPGGTPPAGASVMKLQTLDVWKVLEKLVSGETKK